MDHGSDGARGGLARFAAFARHGGGGRGGRAALSRRDGAWRRTVLLSGDRTPGQQLDDDRGRSDRPRTRRGRGDARCQRPVYVRRDRR